MKWMKIGGGLVASVQKGSAFAFEQSKINDEVWLPAKVRVRMDGRLLMKHFNLAAETTWSDYRKFQVDSRVITGEEAAAPQR